MGLEGSRPKYRDHLGRFGEPVGSDQAARWPAAGFKSWLRHPVFCLKSGANFFFMPQFALGKMRIIVGLLQVD